MRVNGYWATYLVKCSDDTLYCGITNNMKKRIDTHNKSKGARYTRGRTPVVLLKFWIFDSKSKSLKHEYYIKSLSKKDKIKL